MEKKPTTGLQSKIHKGVTIYFVNNRDLDGADCIANTTLAGEQLDQQGLKDILYYIDMTGVDVTAALDREMKRLGAQMVPKLSKCAIIGMSASSVKRVFIKAFMMFTGGNQKLFDTIEQAQEWLVEERLER